MTEVNKEIKKWKEISFLLAIFLVMAIIAIIAKNYGVTIEIPDWAY